MKTLILPIAGESSRFPNVRPKFLLTHPSGNSILTEAIRGLDLKSFNKILVIGLKKHATIYGYVKALSVELNKEYGIGDKLDFCLLTKPTKNQPETVVRGIEAKSIEGEIVIKDCDNCFDLIKYTGNFVGVYKLENLKEVNAGNKSYIKLGKSGEIVNIVEKNVISSTFCCGIYGFKEVSEFIDTYYKLEKLNNIYISHIIYQMILDGKVFFTAEAKNYLDWGTLEDWLKFTSQFATIFIDIDGVLVENSGKILDPKWNSTSGIKKNIATVNKAYSSGHFHIILTTSRDSSNMALTIKQLKDEGLKNWHRLIMDLPHSKRILINDHSISNPYPTAIAINLKRNSEDLSEIL